MQGIFSQYDSQDLNRLAAKGILEKLRNIRQRINVDFTARRLLWELIQNAKDNASTCFINENSKVAIEIEIQPNQLIFRHNNGFFTNENIRGLIRRYSSSDKDREIDKTKSPPTTTGRFGTGFMTTHLLSERVEVYGFFKENEVSFKKFELPLDRTGQTEKEIIQSIETAFSVIEKSISNSTTYNLSESANFKTQFLYDLNDEGYELAKIALSEFNSCIAYTLINIPNIERVSIKHINETQYYELSKIKEYQTDDCLIEIIKVNSNNHNSIHQHFCTIVDGNTRIIIPIEYSDDRIEIQILDQRVPRLFLDFPMIGTEDLKIPFVINNPLFEPTEPRDGISLTGGEDKDTVLNSEIIKKSVNLYQMFIDFASEKKHWQNLFNLARIKNPKDKVWINLEWYNNFVLQPLREKLINASIVEKYNKERAPIKDLWTDKVIWFPYSSNKDVREKIWDLASKYSPNSIPRKSDIHSWYEIVWDGCNKLTLEVLTYAIQEKENLDNLGTKLNCKIEDTIIWMNDYFDLLNLEGKFIDEIIKDKFSVIPNQKGIFKTKSELSWGISIDNELKNVLEILDVDIRNQLRDDRIITKSKYTDDKSGQITHYIKEQKEIINKINEKLKQHENSRKAISYLISLFNDSENFPSVRDAIYMFSKALLGDEIPEKRNIEKWDESIWEYADKARIDRLVKTISNSKTTIGLTDLLNNFSLIETKFWLQSFINFLLKNGYASKLNLKDFPILPNQNKIFKIKDDLFLDNGDIDEGLKQIAEELGYKIKDELLDIDFSLELPENRVRSKVHVAEEISKLIKPILRDLNERERNKEVIRKLYLWMSKNRSEAELIFGDIFEKRFLLISDDEITANIEKAEILDEILNETGLTIDEAKSKIKSFLINEKNSILPATIYENINKLLLEKNISIEQLESLIDMFDGNLEGLIGQGNSDDLSKKAQYEENEKARELVMQKLTNEGYIFTQGIGQNSVVNGVYKNDVEYPLVVKSYQNSSYKFNIKPYEWLQLSKPNAMFWVHRGGGNLEYLELKGLLRANSEFFVRFETDTFSLEDLVNFASVFRFVRNVNFQLDSPNFSAAKAFEDYRFYERNLAIKQEGGDDDKTMH